MKPVKFHPQLMRGNAIKELEENNVSLKERYEAEEKLELKIEAKPVRLVKKIWNGLLIVTSSFFSFLGLVTLIYPLLRSRLIAVIMQFFVEAGLL